MQLMMTLILRLFIYLGRMDKEQGVFEQLTLSYFKNWNYTALKTFNNYTIIIINYSDKIRIS